MSKISIILINYNGGELTVACLKALQEQSYTDFDILLVDNGSTDDSLDAVSRFVKKSSTNNPVRIVPVGFNAGFTGGNAVGWGHAEGEYICVLNNDAEPDREWLKNLVQEMEADSAVGICASKMLVFGTNIIDSAGDGFSTLLKGFKRGEGENSDKYNEQGYVFGACAGAALYRREMLDKIGFFDEDFFLIHEDTDLNFRAQLAGWKVLYVPAAVVYHKVRSTIGNMSDTAVYYTLRNSELARIKNMPFKLFLRYLPELVLGTIAEICYFAIKHGKVRLYIKAKIDAIKLFPEMLRKRKQILNSMKVDTKYLYSIMTPVWNREFLAWKLRKFLSM